jgi:hypothetical protein
MTKRHDALGSSPLPPLDAIGIDTTDHVYKLLRGKASTRPYTKEDKESWVGIIAWQCTRCKSIFEVMPTSGKPNSKCSGSDGGEHTYVPIRGV